MKVRENKNIGTFIAALFVSITVSIFCFLIFIYIFDKSLDSISLDAIEGIILGFVLPTFILYLMGLYLVLTAKEEKKNMLGYIMIAYTFFYIMYWSVYIVLSDTWPSSKIIPYIFEEIAFILNISAIWYSFNGMIFWSYNMKKHLCAACISLLIIIVFLLFYVEGIY